MEKKIFPKNYLTEIILRADFNSPIILDSKTIKELHKLLPFKKKEYKEDTVKGYEIKIDKGNETFHITHVGKSGTFTINDQPIPTKITVDHEKFLVTSAKYERFTSFNEVFLKGFDTFQKIRKVVEFKRIGMRFINIISLGDKVVKEISEWKEFINPAFVPNYKLIKIEESEFQLRRNMNSFVFGDGEMFANVQIGIWNNSYPGKIVDREFVLDIDCFIDNRILSDSEIIEVVKGLNEKAYKIFYSLTTPRLKKMMEAK